MGICISCSASGHKIQDGNENAMFFRKNSDVFGAQSHGSLYSKEGSKGLNQDSAILYQVCYSSYSSSNNDLFINEF